MGEYILLAAGGTGGHLFPAEALAHEMKHRGYSILLVTDKRAQKYADDFPADRIEVVPSATFASKNPVAIVGTMWTLLKGYLHSRRVLKEVKPVAAIGFGGYPTLPPMAAAMGMKIPSLIHEQNAILGRANRLLAKKVKAIGVGFQQVGEIPDIPIVETGNPVRPMVKDVMDVAYRRRKPDETFRLVIFGGSQGARFLSESLPEALAMLGEAERGKISVLQQAREEDHDELRRRYDDLKIDAEIAPFFKNMPEEIAKAHFVIARAGASSVTELAVIGRPSLLVPLPGSLDGDQAANAIAMEKHDGAFVVKQGQLNAQKMAEIIKTGLAEPDRLSEMAANASKTGIANAGSRLADCVECVISGKNITTLKF